MEKKLELIEKKLDIQTKILGKLIEQYSRLYKQTMKNTEALIASGLIEIVDTSVEIDLSTEALAKADG